MLSRFQHLFHPNVSLTTYTEHVFNKGIFYLTFATIWLNKAFIFIEIILSAVNLVEGEMHGTE
jgi:hypothetical protein